MSTNVTNKKRGLGTLMVALSLFMAGTSAIVNTTPVYAATFTAVNQTASTLPKTLPASGKVLEVIKYDSPVLTTKAKPAPHIKMVIDGQLKNMTDPVLMENGRVFLPIRNVGALLGVNVDYLEKEKIAVAFNDKAYLELPLGYNTAVKDQTILLPVDANNKDTRIFTYNNRTYLPVRFVSENLGFQITYSNNTVTITTKPANPTDKPDTNNPTDPSGFDTSKMSPSDASNIYNLQAFKDGRSLSVMPKASWSQISKPVGVSDLMWNKKPNLFPNGAVVATGKLSDMPKDINRIKNGKEDLDKPGMSVSKITVNSKGVLQSTRCGAPTYIYFKDGTYAEVHFGADASIGLIPNTLSGQKPGKTLNDIACITVSDTQAQAEYVFFVTGK